MRDADRIMAAAKDARLTQIDHLITTHYHGDHYGAMTEVASRIPIKDFIDHGPNVQPAAAADEFLQKVYPQLYAKSKHTIAKPGDKIELKGLDARVVASAGQMIASPLPGAGNKNPYCAAYKPKDPDPIENAQSVGTHVTFGRFKTVHLGDLTWNKESDLMCPTNRLGAVDLFIVSHHGQAISNSEVLVHALAPRVAIMNNGTRKGGQPDAMKVMHSSPGLEDSVADPLLAVERPGVHRARDVHRQRRGRAAGGDAHRRDGRARARTRSRAAAGAQRAALLDQSLRA